jgi:hypothetical protein
VACGGWSAPRSRRAGHGWLVEDGVRAWRPMARAGGGARVIALKVARQVSGSATWCLRGGRGGVTPPWAWWVSRTPDLVGVDAAVGSRGHGRGCSASRPSALDRACSWCWSAVAVVCTKRSSLHRSSLVRGAIDVRACMVGRLVGSCESTMTHGGRGLHS